MKSTEVTIKANLFMGEVQSTSDEELFAQINRILRQMADAGDVIGLMEVSRAASAMSKSAVQKLMEGQQKDSV